MSANSSWRRRCRSHDEVASVLVKKCVGALKKSGFSSNDSALRELAGVLHSSPRRMRNLYYGDSTPLIADYEWNSLRRRAALFFLNMERKHLELAEQYRAQHSAMAVDQLEFGLDEQACGDTNDGPVGAIAFGQR